MTGAALHGPGTPPSRGALALMSGRRAVTSFNTRAAIWRAVAMLGLSPGDEVLAPAWNCGSELDPLLAAGLGVRLYPADGQGVVDPDRLGQMIGPATRAVYLIHYFGFLQPHAAEIRAVCAARGLRLIEDCALSLLSGPAPGVAGDVALLCFYKFFPVLAGGALLVNAPDLPDPAPFARPAPFRPVLRHVLKTAAAGLLGPGGLSALRRRRGQPTEPPPAEGVPDMPGHYYFDPDLADRDMSGLTLQALARVDVAAEIAARRAGYARYLAALEGLSPLFPQLTPGTAPLGMPVRVAPARRDAVVRGLQAEGIAATPWWAGYHRGLDFAGQTEANRLKDSLAFLPLGAGIGPAEIDRSAALLRRLLRES